MKYYILLAFCVLSIAIPSTAQIKSKPVIKKKAVAARTKFDPKRDPAADLKLAIEQASKTGKYIILDVGGEWCSWCVYMDEFFIKNPQLTKLRDQNFIWMKVNFSEENENTAFLSTYPDITGYPYLFVLNETGKLIQSQDTSPLEGGKSYNPERVAEFLKTWSKHP